MKRVVREMSGREIYGPKWQNLEANSSENDDDDDALLHSASIQTTATPLAVAETNGQIPEGINIQRIRLSNSHESMYRATLEGDSVAAEMLLQGDPNLASDEISEDGDRALHVAAALKHQEIVRKLVEKMSPTDLALLDGNGYTACCYAAISGEVDIADSMIRKNPTLATARDRENKTPLHKAAMHRNAKMVSYFLKYAKVEDLSTEEWFDLLLVTIRRKMYAVALQIAGSNDQLAIMRNDEGTALHLLAKQRFYVNEKQRNTGVMRQDLRLLADKLWEGIQRLGKDSVVELMKNPPILHNAAKVGNMEFITMLTHIYPHLVWHTNSKGYTIFHIAVKHRQWNLFGLIDEIGARKDLIALSQDENGNNILHLAAEVGPRDWRFPMFPTIRLQKEMLWFEEVKAIVPPFCLKMKNKDGHTPHKLFLKKHKSLLEKNTTWMMNTADSWMLISTLLFSVIFASAFAIPGGYNQETGIPILSNSNWFTCFIIFEALAMFFSAFSVLMFSRIMMVTEEDAFKILPICIDIGLILLSLSVVGAISVFMSAYFLVYVQERAALAKSVIIVIYLALIFTIFSQNLAFHRGFSRRLFPKKNRHTLFKRHDGDTVGQNRRRRRCWIFEFLRIGVVARM